MIFQVLLTVFLCLNSPAIEINLASHEKKIKTKFQIEEAVGKISGDSLRKEMLSFLQKTRPNRFFGSDGHLKAQSYIESLLKSKSNGELIVQTFEVDSNFDRFNSKRLAKNYIWKTKVNSEEKIVFISHYDSSKREPKASDLALNFQSADGSASGVVLQLAMVSLLNELDISKSIEFVFLDSQENHSLGIHEYLKSLKSNNVTIINLSTIGYDSKNNDHLKQYRNMVIYNKKNQTCSKFCNELIERGNGFVPQLKVANIAYSQSYKGDVCEGINNNDLLCYTFSGDRQNDLNQRLGTSDDFMETLNLDTYYFVYKFITTSLLSYNYNMVK